MTEDENTAVRAINDLYEWAVIGGMNRLHAQEDRDEALRNIKEGN